MIAEKNNNKPLLSSELVDSLKKQKATFVPARTSTLPEKRVEEILTHLKKNFEKITTRDEALTVIALLFQQGGTARGCDGNMSVTVFDQTIKLADVRKVMKLNSCGKAERKLARTLASEIQAISQLMETPGNLSAKIRRTHPSQTFTMEQLTWMSDFQSENPSCPLNIRTLILETFKKPETNFKRRK